MIGEFMVMYLRFYVLSGRFLCQKAFLRAPDDGVFRPYMAQQQGRGGIVEREVVLRLFGAFVCITVFAAV